MVNNNCGGMVFITIFGSEALIERISGTDIISLTLLMQGTLGVIGIVSFIMLIKMDKQK